jgi:hypothetical protein
LTAADIAFNKKVRTYCDKNVTHKEALIKQLQDSDHTGTGFLSAMILDNCFKESRLTSITNYQQLYKVCKKNHLGEHNYKQMLVNIFGFDNMRKYLGSIQTGPTTGR